MRSTPRLRRRPPCGRHRRNPSQTRRQTAATRDDNTKLKAPRLRPLGPCDESAYCAWDKCPEIGFWTPQYGYVVRSAHGPPAVNRASGGRQPCPPGCRPPLTSESNGWWPTVSRGQSAPHRGRSADHHLNPAATSPKTPPRNTFVPPASHSKGGALSFSHSRIRRGPRRFLRRAAQRD